MNTQPDIRQTLDILIEALADDVVPSIAYYMTAEDVERGGALLVPAWSGLPRFFVVHPDDLDTLRQSLPRYITLAHFRDWRPV